jgi:DNA repair ATPase RecN
MTQASIVDNKVVIADPIMRGAVPDYKRTAEEFAARTLSLQDQLKIANDHIRDQAKKLSQRDAHIQELYTDFDKRGADLARLRSHWAVRLFAKGL